MFGTYSGTLNLTNSFFDGTTTGQTLCASQDDPSTDGCSNVNDDGSLPNYFKNNSTNEPLKEWDFTNTWKTNTGYYPTLKSPALQVLAIDSTSSASSVSKTKATLNGSVSDTGLSNVTKRGFVYGKTTSFGKTVSQTGTFGTGKFALTSGTLVCHTKYYYRTFADNPYGRAYGNTKSFTTKHC